MGAGNCKITLIEVAERVESTPQKVWWILLGNTTDSVRLARAIGRELNLSATNIHFHPTENLRSGALDWVSSYLCVAKNTIWRYVHGHETPGKAMKEKLADFAGLDVEVWAPGNVDINWFFSDRGVENVKNRKPK